jgi:hypothetical protein
MDEKDTATQAEVLEKIGFQVPADFKRAVDYAVLDRRSTLRAEGTAALAKHLGIPLPGAQSDQSAA